jgi:hypothetical protein
MNSQALNLASQWARAGAMFSADPAPASPDLEQLLLDTARTGRADPRMFIMAATWLARYGDMISSTRLARLIEKELEPEHRPTLGKCLAGRL